MDSTTQQPSATVITSKVHTSSVVDLPPKFAGAQVPSTETFHGFASGAGGGHAELESREKTVVVDFAGVNSPANFYPSRAVAASGVSAQSSGQPTSEASVQEFSQGAVNKDSTTAPVSHVPTIDEILAMGADSRPSSLMAVQAEQSAVLSGARPAETTVVAVPTGAEIITTVTEKIQGAAAPLVGPLAAAAQPIAQTAAEVTEGTEPLPGMPLQKLGEVVAASAAVFASGLTNLGNTMAAQAPQMQSAAQSAAHTATELGANAVAVMQNAAQTAGAKATELGAKAKAALPASLGGTSVHGESTGPTIGERISEAATTAVDTTKALAGQAVESTRNLASQAAATTSEAVGTVKAKAHEVVDTVSTGANQAAATVKAKASEVVGATNEGIATAKAKATEVATTAVDTTKALANQAAATTSNAVQHARTATNEGIATVKAKASDVAETAQVKAHEVAGVARDTLYTAERRASNAVEEAKEAATTTAATAQVKAHEVAGAARDTLHTAERRASNAVVEAKEAATEASTTVKAKAADAAETARDTLHAAERKASNVVEEAKEASAERKASLTSSSTTSAGAGYGSATLVTTAIPVVVERKTTTTTVVPAEVQVVQPVQAYKVGGSTDLPHLLPTAGAHLPVTTATQLPIAGQVSTTTTTTARIPTAHIPK